MTKGPSTTTTRAARAYLARGWAPIPVEARGKRPLLSRWPESQLGEDDLEIFEGRNVGLLLGGASDELVDVDCEVRRAEDASQTKEDGLGERRRSAQDELPAGWASPSFWPLREGLLLEPQPSAHGHEW